MDRRVSRLPFALDSKAVVILAAFAAALACQRPLRGSEATNVVKVCLVISSAYILTPCCIALKLACCLRLTNVPLGHLSPMSPSFSPFLMPTEVVRPIGQETALLRPHKREVRPHL